MSRSPNAYFNNHQRNELDTIMMTLLKFVDAEWGWNPYSKCWAEYLDPNKGMYQIISTTSVIQCHEDTPEDAILLHTEF